MSVEDDTELRDLLTQTLEANGCLAKIRAQLRASVFLALDDDEEINKKQPLINTKIKAQLETLEGKIMFCIVREFLEFFDLDFTISVYEPESYLGIGYKYEGRYKIIQDLNIPSLDKNSPTPLLLQLIQIAKLKGENKLDINLSHIQNNCMESNKETDSRDSSHTNDESSKNSTATSAEEILSEISEQVNADSSHEDEKSVLEQESKQNNLNLTFNVPTSALTHDESPAKDITDVETKSDSEKCTNSNSAVENKTGFKSTAKSSDSEKSDQSVEADFSPPIVKDTKFSKFETSLEKLKKNDKLKPKNYSEFPPIQLNKSRGNDTMILPFLYSKEFKDKCSLKESDKFLDLDLDSMDNYEEDFMSGSELELSLGKNDFLKTDASSKVNLSDDFQHMRMSGNVKHKNVFGTKTNELSKQLKSPENSLKSKENSVKSKSPSSSSTPDKKTEKDKMEDSINSSITSEDFDISSNVSGSN